MASTNLKTGSNAILVAVLAVGSLVLINVISSRLFGRIDLTEDQIYTISDASRKLVSELPDRLTIKAFISSDLPPQIQNVARYLRDILDEYATYSKGKVYWEAIDPGKDEKLKEEARRLKVQQAQLSVLEKTKASVSESFLGVAFQYGGKVESIPFVQDIGNLEYDISSTIKRLTSKPKKIGVTSGHGEASFHQEWQNAKEWLKDYEVTTVDLTEGKTPVPEDIDVLVVVGPTQPFAERAKYELDQFLMKGKSLLLLLDGMTLETPRGQFQPDQTPPRIARANMVGLADMLKYYGVEAKDDLIFDRQSARVVVPASGGRGLLINHPAYPLITNFNREHLMTRDMRAMVPGFPSSLVLQPGVAEGKDGVKGIVLVNSSERSWRQTGFYLFDPLRPPQPTKELGPFPLAVYLSGTFKSYFDGVPVPKAGPAEPMKETVHKPSGKGAKSKPSARLVVVADSEFIKDPFLQTLQYGIDPRVNLILFVNIINSMAQDEALIAIRAKGQTRRPMEISEDSQVTLAKYANIVGLPVVFILFGLLRWRWRRVSRRQRAKRLLEG